MDLFSFLVQIYISQIKVLTKQYTLIKFWCSGRSSLQLLTFVLSCRT